MDAQYYLYLRKRLGKKENNVYYFYNKHSGWIIDEKGIILGCLIDYKDEFSIWDIDEISEDEALAIMERIDSSSFG